MKATIYKRVLGLFVLTFAFFVIGMPKVEAANDIKKQCQNKLDDYKAKYEEQYLPTIVYKKGTANLYIDPNNFKDDDDLKKQTKNMKFKLVAMYGVDEYEKKKTSIAIQGHLEPDGKPVNGVQKYKETLYADSKKQLSIINLAGLFDEYDTIQFEFEPDGYVDKRFKTNEYKECCEKHLKNHGICGVKKIVKEFGVEYASANGEDWNTNIKIDTQTKSGESSSSTELTANSVDCDNGNYAKDSFEYKFCYAKKKAIAAGNEYNFTDKTGKKEYLKFGDKNKPKEFKCDKNVFVENVLDTEYKNKTNNVDSESYYVEKNTQYLYGYTIRSVEVHGDDGKPLYYQYNYDWKKSETEELTCKLKCEEAVTVEYGPPVAASAGLCFGYKVRVTSRVVCNQAEGEGTGVKEPRKVYPVCTPSPQCVHEGGKIYTQGGPNDPFDKCVNSCDGGKYTDKCVNKCYKSVYGTSISASTMAKKTLDTLSSANVEKVADACDYDGKGYVGYFIDRKDQNKIKWDIGQNDKNKKTISYRWYCYNNNPKATKRDVHGTKSVDENVQYIDGGTFPFDPTWHQKNKWGINTKRTYNIYDSDSGIPKHEGCNDNCSWQGCTNSSIYGKEFYLNEKQAKIDAEHNQMVYSEAKKQCVAAATCTTTESEYIIGASYKIADGNGKITTQTVSFPYSKEDKNKNSIDDRKKDTIKNDNGNVSQCYTKNFNSWLPSVINQDGCYACDQKDRKGHWYQTEWTFGDTWFKDKDGSVFFSYDEIPGEKGAKVQYPRRFCLPTSIQPVNSKWWYVHQKHFIKTENETTTYKGRELSTSKENIDNLSENGDACATKKLEKQYNSLTDAGLTYEGDIWYNIFAKARKFGYFEWDIDIDCFYATPAPNGCVGSECNNATTTNSKEDPSCPDPKGKSSSDMRVRIIDLANPFPGENGDTTVDSKATQGIAHFNWTNYAKQTSKDVNYKSTPEAYKKWMINKGYDIYSEEYLDYEINLTKSAINEIKKENHKYTDFGNDSRSYIHDDVTSRTIYKSQFLRDASLFKGNNKLPSDAAIKCNNMKNYNSTECEDFEGGNN